MEQLTRALLGGLETHRKKHWVMVSLTVRHSARMPLSWTKKGLMSAWRKCRSNGTVARIFKKHVGATARAIEVTQSSVNGWHPHIHLAILTSEWESYEKEAFTDAWRNACADAMGSECEPDETHGVRWSQKKLYRGDGDKRLQAYMTDIGLELSLGGSKTTRANASRSPWQIAHAAVRGDDRSVLLWQEYERAMKGTRVIELDERAAAFAREFVPVPAVGDVGEVKGELSFENAEVVGQDSVYIMIHPEQFYIVRAVERWRPNATREWLDVMAAPGPLDAKVISDRLDAWLRKMMTVIRSHEPRARDTVAA
jgi:hypothetical protein